MTVQEEYLAFKKRSALSTRRFEDRVRLHRFLQANIKRLWAEMTSFSSGGLFSNDMTEYALGFAYYDCRPTRFCRERCYGLAIAGAFDFNMFRLAVLTSESLKTGDQRYLGVLIPAVRKLRCLKIGHWGDAVLDQVPVVADVAKECSGTTCWWYTRKLEIAMSVNALGVPNLQAYLSIDPSTSYPSPSAYPFRLTYVFGDGQRHPEHDRILSDSRLAAIFLLKRGGKVQDPDDERVLHHPKLCREKLIARVGGCTQGICLTCRRRCNFQQDDIPKEEEGRQSR
jgi:hypothetical protein